MSEADRRYNDREMAVILRLASEIDARGAESMKADSLMIGRTLGEIEDIAADAGIDPEAVRAAVAALEQRDEGFLSRLVGAPTLFRIERLVAGEVPAGEVRELIRSAEWTLGGKQGEVSESAETVTWHHKTDEGPSTQIEVARRGGQTRIRVLAKHENPAGWTLLGTGVTTIVSTAIVIAAVDPSQVGAIATLVGMAGVNLLGARAIWRRHAAAVQRKLHDVADKIEQQARAIAARI
jgi:hypothetical protein